MILSLSSQHFVNGIKFEQIKILWQDLMLLDQSVFFGIADIHDRHRDMRLDIDNMSYEV